MKTRVRAVMDLFVGGEAAGRESVDFPCREQTFQRLFPRVRSIIHAALLN
jgi:hypothetical protein